VYISEQTTTKQISSTSRRKPEITQTTISLGHINKMTFVINMATFSCAVRTGFSDKTEKTFALKGLFVIEVVFNNIRPVNKL
jgi:hypothetical protein